MVHHHCLLLRSTILCFVLLDNLTCILDLSHLWTKSVALEDKKVFDSSQIDATGHVKVLADGTYLLYAQVQIH